jgi:ABC-type polysaccharide/polyol phosphate transport system ATPase subunit
MSSALSCNGVSKTFTYATYGSLFQDALLRRGNRQPQWSVKAVNNVSLDVRQGEWVGLYGPNGSGKTTLLRMIARVLPPDSGHVHVEGKLSSFLGLGTGFEPELTAAKNIYLHGLLYGMSPRHIAEVTPKIIKFAGVESHQVLPIKCYSSGMQLRLGFAAAAQIDADIYLFDEVLAVGDAAFGQQCIEHLKSLRAQGKTAVLVSHDVQSLRSLCDRIVYVHAGSIAGEERTIGAHAATQAVL